MQYFILLNDECLIATVIYRWEILWIIRVLGLVDRCLKI